MGKNQRGQQHRPQMMVPSASRLPSPTAETAKDELYIWVVAPHGYQHHHAFDEVVRSTVATLSRIGFDAPVHMGPVAAPQGRPLVFGAHLLARPDCLPRGSVVYNLEQLDGIPTELLTRYRPILESVQVIDFCQQNVDLLARWGVEAWLVPIGYEPVLESIEAAPAEDIDVLFIGSLTERRVAILETLRAAGIDLDVRFGVYGSERDSLYARAKIVLNLHAYETSAFEVVRVSYLLANRRPVLSELTERDADSKQFHGGLALSSVDDLVQECQTLLERPDLRQSFADRGYHIVRGRDSADALRMALAHPRELNRGQRTHQNDPCSVRREAPSPLVTIVVPTYNRRHLLPRCLASLRAQTYGNLEVIVVNDGGVPVSDLVQAAGLANTRLIDLPFNQGRSSAMNAGIHEASGDLVGLLADDDAAMPHHVLTLVDHYLEQPHPSVVYSYAVRVNESEDGTAESRSIVGDQAWNLDLLRVTNYIAATAVLAPTSAVISCGGFDETLAVLEDWDLWLRLSTLVPFSHVSLPTVEYRWRPGRANATTREWFRFHGALERVYAKNPLPAMSPLRRLRGEMLEGSAPRSAAFAFRVSVALLCDDEPAKAWASLASYSELAGAYEDCELLLVLPGMDGYAEMVGCLEGDVQAFAAPVLNHEALLAYVRQRASGRSLVWFSAGERLSATEMAAALEWDATRAYHVGEPSVATPTCRAISV